MHRWSVIGCLWIKEVGDNTRYEEAANMSWRRQVRFRLAIKVHDKNFFTSFHPLLLIVLKNLLFIPDVKPLFRRYSHALFLGY